MDKDNKKWYTENEMAFGMLLDKIREKRKEKTSEPKKPDVDKPLKNQHTEEKNKNL